MKYRVRRLWALKRKTGWSWERMCRECHTAMGTEGPSHTTLFRYARSRVKKPNVLVERWIDSAVSKLELSIQNTKPKISSRNIKRQ